MKSGKQRRDEIKAKRLQRQAKLATTMQKAPAKPLALRMIAVNEAALAPYKSYGAPAFVMRGYYQDMAFRCRRCGKEELWTGTQQKWWYEVAKGYVYSTAKFCRLCRKKEQARRAQARGIHLEGLARKNAARQRE
jgi:hypothetical protein